jgi:hypothetical protein
VSSKGGAKDLFAEFGLDFDWATTMDLNPRVVNVEGEEFTGKSFLALTGPEPIGYQSLDFGESRVLPHFRGKQIGVKRYQFDFNAALKQKADWEKQADNVRDKWWNPFEADFRKMAASGKFKTIIWDQASDVNVMLRLAHYGKLTQVPQEAYGIVNAEFKELVQFAKKCGVNLVLIHSLKDEYEERIVETGRGPQKQRFKTGKMLRQGNNAIGYLIDVSVRMTRIEKKGEPVKFRGQILKAGANKDVLGMELDNPDWDTLMAFVQPPPPTVEGAGEGISLD